MSEERHRVGGRHLHAGRELEHLPEGGGHDLEARGQRDEGGGAEERDRLEERHDERAQDRGQGQRQGHPERGAQAPAPRVLAASSISEEIRSSAERVNHEHVRERSSRR